MRMSGKSEVGGAARDGQRSVHLISIELPVSRVFTYTVDCAIVSRYLRLRWIAYTYTLLLILSWYFGSVNDMPKYS
jgi:hypothetical protein